MAPNSETSDCEAVRTEGVTRGVTGVTISHSVADTQRASEACVGPCRPDVNSEAVTSNQARLGLSPEGAEAVQRRNAHIALYPIHPSMMALISRPEYYLSGITILISLCANELCSGACV